MGFEAIILHEQASRGRTIIEKIEDHGEVGFAVVLVETAGATVVNQIVLRENIARAFIKVDPPAAVGVIHHVVNLVVAQTRAGLRAARAEYIPDVSAFAQHIYQNGAPFLSHNNGAFGVHMTWTIFEFGKRRAQVSEREAEIAQAEENLTRLRNRVRIDVEKAVRKLNRAETGVQSASELVASTSEVRRVSSDQWEAGTANRSVLLESESSMLSAQADLLRAEYDRGVAAADLARLNGTR